MDHVSASSVAPEVARARRKHMRDKARGRQVATLRPEEYQTHQWLDRSFVLPIGLNGVTEVPSQFVPHHNDHQVRGAAPAAESEANPAKQFVRLSGPEVDFAKVIRRADVARTAARTAAGASGTTALMLTAYLLTSSPVVLGMTISFGLVSLIAIVLRVRLTNAALPRIDR